MGVATCESNWISYTRVARTKRKPQDCVYPVAFRNANPTELWQRRPVQWRRLQWQNPLAGKDEYLIWESASCECERSVRATKYGQTLREITDGKTQFSFLKPNRGKRVSRSQADVYRFPPIKRDKGYQWRCVAGSYTIHIELLSFIELWI